MAGWQEAENGGQAQVEATVAHKHFRRQGVRPRISVVRRQVAAGTVAGDIHLTCLYIPIAPNPANASRSVRVAESPHYCSNESTV